MSKCFAGEQTVGAVLHLYRGELLAGPQGSSHHHHLILHHTLASSLSNIFTRYLTNFRVFHHLSEMLCTFRARLLSVGLSGAPIQGRHGAPDWPAVVKRTINMSTRTAAGRLSARDPKDRKIGAAGVIFLVSRLTLFVAAVHTCIPYFRIFL
jgi:hypothetical protein